MQELADRVIAAYLGENSVDVLAEWMVCKERERPGFLNDLESLVNPSLCQD